MNGAMMRNALVLSAMIALLAAGCGGKNCDPGCEDAGADEVEDIVLEPDGVDDPDVIEEEVIDDPVVEDVVDEDEPDAPPGVDCSRIEEYITQAGLLAHLEQFEAFADTAGGTRLAGTTGFDDTIDYVEDRLTEYGYTPVRQDIDYPYYVETTDPVLEMTSPTTYTYTFCNSDCEEDPTDVTGDFQRIHFSRPGNVTAEVQAVDLDLGPGNTSSSGCETEDFDAFTPGRIALIQRGTCPYIIKALNAEAEGASAMILFNQGNTTEREGLSYGGALFIDMVPIFPEHNVHIPSVFATYTAGAGIAAQLASGAVIMHLNVSDTFEIRTSQNILAETATGNPDEVVILGGHMDSEEDSPGINDNASGIATTLEIARLVAECDPVRKIRFGFWATEEWRRPWGSLQYVGGLSDTELEQIFVYLNLDMIASPNYAVFIYDGGGEEFYVPGPPGSGELERWFIADLLLRGYTHTPFWSLGSDHYGFFLAGVAHGGVTAGSGLEGDIKTDEEFALYGGTAGELYDPCHHEPCDRIDNIDMDIYEVLSKSYANSVQFFGVDGMSVLPLP